MPPAANRSRSAAHLLPRFPFFIMQQAAPELKRTFLDFVDQKGYFGQIKAMLSRKPPDQRLVLSLDDLREFDSELAATFVKRPAEYLPAFEEALQEAVEQEDAAFAKQVNVSHFRIAVNGDFGAHRVTPRTPRASRG